MSMLKRIVPPAPFIRKDSKGNELAKVRAFDVLIGIVMKQPFWREHTRAAVELIDRFEAAEEGPWDVSQEEHATLKASMLLSHPGGQTMTIDDPPVNKMFLKTKMAVDEADAPDAPAAEAS